MATPNLLLPDWGNAGNQLGQALGARIERNKLAELVPGALSGDQNALNQLTAYNPRLGMMAMDHQRQAAADKAAQAKERLAIVRQDLTDTAGQIVNMPEADLPNAWAGIRAGLVGRNPELASRLPEQYTPEVLATARGLAGIKPQNPAGPTDDMREYAQAQAQGYKGSFVQYQTDLKKAGASSNNVSFGGLTAGVDANGNPVFAQASNKGGAQIVPGIRPPPNAATTKDPTEDQSKAAGWLAQAVNAYSNAEKVLAENPGSDLPNVGAEVLGAVPLVGGAARNAALTPGQQKYQQAMSSFAEAALRAATGAGVNRDEASQKIRELTPQIGDSKEVREQKRASLMVYLDSFKTRAGRAAPNVQIPNAAAGNTEVPADIAAILQRHGKK